MNDFKIRKIGGKLEEDYYQLMRVVSSLNSKYVPFLLDFGFKDTDTIIDTIITGNAKTIFIDKIKQKINNGKIRIEKVLPGKTLQKINIIPTREEREKRLESALNRSLGSYFNQIEREREIYLDEPSRSDKFIIRLSKPTIFLTTSGLCVDVDKFIEFYTDYLKADESITKKSHQEAADAINRFFNSLEITEKELKRYFVIEDGRIKVNAFSINSKDYARLGARTGKVNGKKIRS